MTTYAIPWADFRARNTCSNAVLQRLGPTFEGASITRDVAELHADLPETFMTRFYTSLFYSMHNKLIRC